MSETATETQDKPVENPDETGVEIVVAGEEEPTSKPKVNRFDKSVRRLTGQRNAARDEAEEANAKAAAAEEEARLLRLKLAEVANPSKPPEPGDFESDAEFEAAKQKFDDERIEGIALKKAREIANESQNANAQRKQVEKFEGTVKAHHERAAALQLEDFEDVEDQAMDNLGDDLARYIIAYHGNSEMMIYHLGKNPDKAQRFRALRESGNSDDAVTLTQELTRLNDRIGTKPKHSPAPSPEATVAPGDALPSDWQRKLDKVRADVETGKATVRDVLAIKQEARAAGAKIV